MASDKIVAAKTLSWILGLNISEVHELAKDGRLVKVVGSNSEFFFETSVRNYVRHLREIAAGRQGNELNAVDENARLKIVQRKNYELKNAALEGTLVPMEDITEAWGLIVRAIKAMVLSFPARCHEKLPHLKSDDVETIRKVAHKVLTETSRMLPAEAPMPQTGSALSHDNEGA